MPSFKLTDVRFQALIAVVIASVFLAFSPVSFFIMLLGALVLFSSKTQVIFRDTPSNAMGLSNERLVTLNWSDLLAWSTIVCLTLAMLLAGPVPGGDMLRHLTASEWGYDTTQHYSKSGFTHTWSWWWGWEKALSWVYEATDKDIVKASRIARAFMVAICGTCLWLGFSRAGGKNRELAALCFIYTMVFLCWDRLIQGRPDLIMLCAIGIASYCTSRLVWLVVMVPLIPAHWLSWVISCSAFMLRSRSREDYVANMSAGFLFFCMSVSFWFLLFGTEYFEVPGLVLTWIDFGANRVTDLISAAFSLVSPLKLVSLLFCTVAIVHAKDKFAESVKMRWEIMCWLACPFVLALPDIAVYISSICAVLMLIGLRLYALVPIKLSVKRICLYAGLMVAFYGIYQSLSLGGASVQPRTIKEIPSVPDGSRILTPFNGLQHLASAVYSGATITPVFELGALTKEQLKIMSAINGGWLDCATIGDQFDYVLEDTLHGLTRPCLKLIYLSGGIRLWRVNPTAVSGE